jgi:hypothetical protein
LSGVISVEGVCRRYGLSLKEYDSVNRTIERHSLHGLRSIKLQDYLDGSRQVPALSMTNQLVILTWL